MQKTGKKKSKRKKGNVKKKGKKSLTCGMEKVKLM